MIREVKERKDNGQLMVFIPKRRDIKKGDFVRIMKVPIMFEVDD